MSDWPEKDGQPLPKKLSMTRAEASHIGLLWPERMKALGVFQDLENRCGEMREELAARLSKETGKEILPEHIVNMDWTKREATILIPKKAPEPAAVEGGMKPGDAATPAAEPAKA